MRLLPTFILLTGLCVSSASSGDLREDMRRAEETGRKSGSLITNNDFRPFWSADGSHLAYRIRGTNDELVFSKVHLRSGTLSPAFDHDLLAKALAKAAGRVTDGRHLPLDQLEISADGTVRFRAFEKSWRWDASAGQVSPDDLPPQESRLLAPEEIRGRSGRSGPPSALTIENGSDGEIEIFWVSGRERKSYGRIEPGGKFTQNTYAGHVWLMTRSTGEPLAALEAEDTPTIARVTGRVPAPPRVRDDLSPDKKWKSSIRDHNVFIEPAEGGDAIAISRGGTPENSFNGPLKWSPDSKKIVAFRTRHVDTRQIHIVQSSPPDQLQPKLKTLDYAKPGDALEQPMPCLLEIENRREIPVEHSLFSNPWEINHISWAADSSEFSFVYNQRGHQLMRIVGVRADTGVARKIYEDTSATFIDYSQKTYIHELPETREILWASERDGYNHLYLLDAVSGEVKKQITRGKWNVREVVEVDEKKRRLLLKVMGVTGQDPYHTHFVRVDFDGANFTRLTTSDGNHGIRFSPDGNFILATWSRVDQPPVTELRRADDGRLIAELAREDDEALRKTGWSRPERFVAKGRDGDTDIYGVIIRPTHFDPAKKYPVVEDIYAGPHDFFVPKNYSTWSGMNAMAELGFVIVKMDGMGTNWRSRAFHDVCWKNLSDSGFPDRIAWIKAAAASRPWMDLTRVGIYGGSAGGQSTLAGLLHHGDFYKAGVADCGCHDNRMDKIWWNEAWMGWPVDDSYANNSNVTHAAKLTGKLMLVVGELDTNVDPASTAQVVNALQQAGKEFDYIPVMNAGHGAAETPYGKFRRAGFLRKNLLGE
ncbi:prolyl oligopeptidase family serine peptidase [Luteolibacter yonseiensis]|uniref:Prolyl oligopeptidase family serine peptidase n=1 Tax=Luteolibacter yonseiensis TaxID=1144680 RepID=A0A934RAI8_9BACT|nr:prolyl oligopeptidase family serine peptidase [Luteolibacter yonseiensis]MBK1818170.1 prolyl oligopeptidase family serine peptidase [Luteolibacter yonseiensis]